MTDVSGTAREEVLVNWDARTHVLKNSSIWRSMLLVCGIPSVLLGILLAVVAGDLQFALLLPLGAMAVLFGIFLAVALAIDAFGGFKVAFALTTAGVLSLSGKGAKTASNAAVLAGIAAGSPATAGAGLLAKSEQNVFIRWEDVQKIKVREKGRIIQIRGGWADKPIALYCTPENFAPVMEILRKHVPQLVTTQSGTLSPTTP